MTWNGWLQIGLFCLAVVALTRPLGGYLTRVFNGERTFLSFALDPLERGFCHVAGIRRDSEQYWTHYAFALLLFNLLGFLLLYALLRLQAILPLNPAGQGALAPDLTFNTATSFTSNTDWQNYAGESTLSYFTQMAGLTVQNFASAATGIAISLALIRAFTRASAKTIGNFWLDLFRATFYVLLPICIVGTLVLVWQGVPQNLSAYTEATTLEGTKQVIAQGPVASQMMIKHLGTNGGGFFNANAAHPFENPTAFTNFIHMVAIFAIGAALTNVFGRMAGNEWQGWAIFTVMGFLFLCGVTAAYWAEAHGNPLVHALGIDGGNMEGKETRFGIALSALFAAVTTAASCGAVNAMHDSFTALGGLVPLLNMQLGEIIVGGVGAGFYGIMMFVVITMFISGLMVGRTPEYLGKKIEAKEIKMAVLAVLSLPLVMLTFTAISAVLPSATAQLGNAGPHGFTEILYAYTSAAANNGSAFGGLSGNTPWYNITLGFAMLMGRFLVIVPILAMAGSLAAKKIVPASAGTFPTDGPLFIALLTGVIIIVGGLTFFPSLAVGPVVEHFMMLGGQSF